MDTPKKSSAKLDLKGDGGSSPVWEKLVGPEDKYALYQLPKVTVTVPTFNNARTVQLTLDSIFSQQYPDMDVIVVDAGSTDRTLQIISSYYGDRVRLYSVTSFNLSEMFNKGIALAKGQYINFLYPGVFYVSKDTTMSIMSLAVDHETPHLAYGAALLRSRGEEIKILFRPFALSELKKGRQPTSLGACWFRKDVFHKVGGFRLDAQTKGGLDMFCRIFKSGKMEAVSTRRVMVDQEMVPITRSSIVRHFHETYMMVHRYFGFFASLKWALFYQTDLRRLIQGWCHNVRLAFSGKVG